MYCPTGSDNFSSNVDQDQRVLLSSLIKIFLIHLELFECNNTFDWLNHMVKPIRSCVTFQFAKSQRKRQRMFLRMVGAYGPWCFTFLTGNVHFYQ